MRRSVLRIPMGRKADLTGGIRSPKSYPGIFSSLRDLADFMHSPLEFLSQFSTDPRSIIPLRVLNRRVYLLLDPNDIERVLVTESEKFCKPMWLRTSPVRRMLGDGMVTSDGSDWSGQRKSSARSFDTRHVEQYSELIREAAWDMVNRWEPGAMVDLQQQTCRLALRIVGGVLLTGGSEVTPCDFAWVEEAAAAMEVLMVRFGARESCYGLAPIPANRAERSAVRSLNRISEHLIELNGSIPGRTEIRADCETLITRMQRSSGSDIPTKHSVRDQVKTMLGAGHESSSVAVTWAFLLLADNPAAEAAFSEELESVLSGRIPTASDLSELPYTRAVVTETLRLYPPLWLTGRQAAVTIDIAGVTIPAGAQIATSQWVMHRMPQFFEDPLQFKPERWLDGTTASLPRCAYFPFGAGQRICIGQNLAVVEVCLILAIIAQRFHLEPAIEGERRPYPSVTLRPPLGMQMQLIPRTSSDRQKVSI